MLYCERIVATTVVSGVRKFKAHIVADTVAEITANMEVTNLPDEVHGAKLTVANMLNGSIAYVPSASFPIYTLSNGAWVEVTGEQL